jgi:hypothetical protein
MTQVNVNFKGPILFGGRDAITQQRSSWGSFLLGGLTATAIWVLVFYLTDD